MRVCRFYKSQMEILPFYFLLQELQLAIVVLVNIFVLGSSIFGIVVMPVFALLNTSDVSMGYYIFYL